MNVKRKRLGKHTRRDLLTGRPCWDFPTLAKHRYHIFGGAVFPSFCPPCGRERYIGAHLQLERADGRNA